MGILSSAQSLVIIANPDLPMQFTKTGFGDINPRIFPNDSYERATKGKQMKSPAQIPAS
jgi:hypothetical protein